MLSREDRIEMNLMSVNINLNEEKISLPETS